MMVRKPEPGNTVLAQRISAATVDYMTSHETLSARDASLDRLVDQYRRGIDDMDAEESPLPQQPAKEEQQQDIGKKQHRRKKNKNTDRKPPRNGQSSKEGDGR